MKNSPARTLFFAVALSLAACGNEPAKVENQPASAAAPPVSDTVLTNQPAGAAVAQPAEKPAEQPPAPAPDAAPAQPKTAAPPPEKTAKTAQPKAEKKPAKSRQPAGIPEGFVDVAALDKSIRLDIRYATTNNFMKQKVYDCPRCLLRPEAAEAIVEAHKTLQKQGFGLKMYDCYRPRPYQQRLWDITPDPNYVAPPAKGSVHGRGLAVDLTIVDKNGKELDMGTPYDFFGEEAHTDYQKLPAQVLENRRLLRETLAAVGFGAIVNEWWHYNFKKKEYPLSDALWPCE